jgi:hypothetical protein
MTVKGDGKVGIGTAAPTSNLHVSGSAASANYAATISNDSGGGRVLKLYNHDWDVADYLIYASNGGTPSLPHFKFVVDGNARVGIGTDTPYYKLHTEFTDNTTVLSGGSGGNWGGNGIRIDNNSTTVGSMAIAHFRTYSADWHIGNRFISSGPDKSDFFFKHETTEVLTILNDGKVGIGTTAPERSLHVVGGIHMNNGSSLSWDQAGGDLRNAIRVDSGDDLNIGDTNFDDIYFSTGQKTNCVSIKQTTGNFGIGTTAPSYLLDVNGTARLGALTGTTATFSGYISQGTGQSHYFRGGTDANWRIGSDITTDTGGLVTGAAVQMIVGGWGNTYGFQIFGHATPTSPCFEVIPNTTVATSITNVRGKLYINNTQVIDNSRNLTNIGTITTAGDITVGGDLTINGTTTTVSATNLLVDDPLMLLARVQTGTPTLDCGLIMERGTSTNVGMIWDESADQFAFINTTDTATTAGNVTIASYAPLQIGALTGTSATFSGALTLAGGHTLQNVGGDLEIQSTGDDINIVGSWIRIKSSSGAAIRSAWRSTGELTLGGDAQNTHMLKVVSGTTSLGGALTGTTATFSGTTTVHNIVQSGSSGSSFYATTFSRSGSGMTSPDIWDVGGTGIAIGHNSSTAMLKVKSYGVIVGGTISGTSATFSSTIAATELNVSQSANSTRSYKLLQGYGYTVGGNYYGQYAIGTTYDSGANTGTLEFFTGSGSSAPTAKLTIASGGTATFSGALAGTSATFSGAVTIGQTTGTQTLLVESTNGYAQLKVKSGTHQREWTVDTAGNFYIWQANNSIRPINVSADGNVGIGTVAPYGGLHVNASNYAESPTINKAILVSDSADVTKYLILTYHASADVGIIQGLDDSTAWKNVAINPNGGNVGIGTTLPRQSLQVGAIDTANDGVRVTNAGSLNNKSVLGFGGSYIQPMAAVGGVVESAVGFTAGGLYFSTRTATSDTVPTERMRITSAGKVGIGTTVPSRLFDVNGTSYFRDDIYFGNTVLNPVSGFNTQIGMGWDKSTGEFQIAASSTTALQVGRITTTGVIQQWRYAGTVVAAVESSGQIQSVGGALSAPSFAFTNDTDTGMSRPTTNALNFITAGAERVRIDANGKVGIGTTAPSAKIHVAGTGDVARIGDNHWRGTNAVTVGTTYVTGVTVNLANHKSGYLKVIISGDWSGHSAIGFMAEYFIQKGSTARYSQPGTVIREVTNQHNSDFITSQILDPTLNDGNADFAIQFKTNTGSVSCTVMYEFTGIANSVT